MMMHAEISIVPQQKKCPPLRQTPSNLFFPTNGVPLGACRSAVDGPAGLPTQHVIGTLLFCLLPPLCTWQLLFPPVHATSSDGGGFLSHSPPKGRCDQTRAAVPLFPRGTRPTRPTRAASSRVRRLRASPSVDGDRAAGSVRAADWSSERSSAQWLPALSAGIRCRLSPAASFRSSAVCAVPR